MAQTKRIEWLDIVKYICIIMVMLSHLEADTDLWAAFYSPFFLTAFFFASGYAYKPKNNFKVFLYKKFRQLFIPWLFFSVFNILLSQIISFNEHESFWTELKWNFLQIRGAGDEIWFVAALFVAFIPFYFFIKLYDGNRVKSPGKGYFICFFAILIAWVLSLISILYSKLMPAEAFPWHSSALPWHVEYMFQAMFYMALGYIFRHHFEMWLDKHNDLKHRIIVWVLYLLIVYVPYFMGAEMPFALSILYRYISAIAGITAIVMISKVVKTNRYVSYVGQNTLIFFALHGKVYSLIQTVLKKFAGGFYSAVLSNVAASSVFALVLALVLSLLLIIPAYIINRWFPFIVGRAKKNDLKL